MECVQTNSRLHEAPCPFPFISHCKILEYVGQCPTWVPPLRSYYPNIAKSGKYLNTSRAKHLGKGILILYHLFCQYSCLQEWLLHAGLGGSSPSYFRSEGEISPNTAASWFQFNSASSLPNLPHFWRARSQWPFSCILLPCLSSISRGAGTNRAVPCGLQGSSDATLACGIIDRPSLAFCVVK